MNMKTGQLSRIPRISRIVLLICILLFAGGIVSLFIVDDDASRSRIAFQTFEVSLMILVIFIPVLVDRIVHVRVTRLMEILFVSFCFSSLILGDVVDFYGRFNWWDDLLHGISGMLLGIVGYSVINIFNKIENNTIKFTPLFVSIWVVCFALALGSLWEIMEFVTDGLFGLNSQQYLLGSGTFDDTEPLVGHEALRDTMQDLMLDLLGSLVIAVIGFFELRKLKRLR